MKRYLLAVLLLSVGFGVLSIFYPINLVGLNLIVNVTGIMMIVTLLGVLILFKLKYLIMFLKETGRYKKEFEIFIKLVMQLSILIGYCVVIQMFSLNILVIVAYILLIYNGVEFYQFLKYLKNSFDADLALNECEEKNKERQREMDAMMDKQLNEKEGGEL